MILKVCYNLTNFSVLGDKDELISVISSTLHRFLRAINVSLMFVFLFLFYLFIFKFFCSMATVSAVLQPCCTCHMLFVLLARCIMCSWQINDDEDD